MAATETSPPATRDPARGGDPLEAAPSPGLAPPPGNPRFPLFDGLRGITIVTILAFHAAEMTGKVGIGIVGRALEAFSVAPCLFFLISGFLLYRPYVAARSHGRSGPRLRRYARRRVLRIVPAYWVALTVLAIVPGVVGVFSGDWWRYYGYLQIYSNRTDGGGIPVAWTLCVEVSFYVLLPLFAALVTLVARRGRRPFSLRVELLPVVLVALGAVLVQLLAAGRHISFLIATSIAGQAVWLCIGMALAVLSVGTERDPRLARRADALSRHAGRSWILAVAAFVGLMVLVPAGGLFGLIAQTTQPQPIASALARIALTGVLIAAMALPAVFDSHQPGMSRRVIGSWPLIKLGVISYSFYLYHFAVTQVIAFKHAPKWFSGTGLGLMSHVHGARTLILFLTALAATTVLATISYRFVELPFLRRKG